MTQQVNPTGKYRFSGRALNSIFNVLLVAAVSLALPRPVLAAASPATAATAAAAASAGTAAPASKTAPPPASEEVPLPQSHVPAFAEVDANHDGKIEWKEAQAVKVPRKVFEQFDFDHDGTLSQTEWLFVRLHMTDFTPPKATGTAAAPATATK